MFTLPDLPFAFDALEPYIDTQTMQIHHGKHHATYVKNLNDLLPDKSEADLENILGTSTDQKVLNNAGGHVNHSLFWKLLSPTPQTPNPKILELKEEFNKKALSVFGSGWVWITQKQIANSKLRIEVTKNQDVPQDRVILGLDVWEHAYYLKYQNRRAEYIEAFWNVINWEEVNKRYE
jgi:Fe-Mn family superoxide dismutase